MLAGSRQGRRPDFQVVAHQFCLGAPVSDGEAALLSAGYRDAVYYGSFVEGDITDHSLLDSLMQHDVHHQIPDDAAASS